MPNDKREETGDICGKCCKPFLVGEKLYDWRWYENADCPGWDFDVCEKCFRELYQNEKGEQ